MISHRYKCIFIHIPKCAGTTVEHHLGARPFDINTPNYGQLTGWDPKTRTILHHAKAAEIKNIVSARIWDSYFKFAFIRSPIDRALSGWKWLKRTSKIKGSFEDYLEKAGPFRAILHSSGPHGCGVHLEKQTGFLSPDLDFVGTVENFNQQFKAVCKVIGAPTSGWGKQNSTFWRGSLKEHQEQMVREKYWQDMKLWGSYVGRGV